VQVDVCQRNREANPLVSPNETVNRVAAVVARPRSGQSNKEVLLSVEIVERAEDPCRRTVAAFQRHRRGSGMYG
jgi:hypothetical protein